MARDYNVQEYFPSARVRLIVRLEDFGDPSVPAPPVKPPHLWKGKGDTRTTSEKLEVVQTEGRFELRGPGGDAAHIGGPQEQTASDDQRTFAIDGILPVTATLKRNSMLEADQLTVECAFADMPFDPRVIRSAAVEFFLGCVTADDYQRGIQGEVRADATPSGPLARNVVPDEYVSGTGHLRSNLRFRGWVDTWDTEFPETDPPSVTLNCTDNTRAFIEQDAPPKLTLDPAVAIDKAIADYLSNFPQYRGYAVEYRPHLERAQIPTMKESLAKTKYQPKLGPPPTGGTGGMGVWEYLTDCCMSIGHFVRVDGTTIVVQRVRSYYDARFERRPDDAFVPRKLPSGRALTHRLFIYGHDVAELSFSRKYAKHVPQNVEIRSYDTSSKKVIVVRFPEKDDRQINPTPGNATSQKWKVLSVPGVTSAATLKLYAQQVYEQLGRRELITRVVTKNLASFGGDNTMPDVLDCEPGDTVDVEVLNEGAANLNTVLAIEEQLRTQGAEFLRHLGYSDALAKAYVAAKTNIGLPTTFRVRSLSMAWDVEQGVTLDLECQNYVEIRADKDVPASEQITPSDQAAADASGEPSEIRIADYSQGVE